MSRIMYILLALCLFLVPMSASAYYQVGDREFTLSGTGTSDEEFDNTTMAVDFGLGYFFSENLEGVLRQNVTLAEVPGDDEIWNGSTRIGFDFNFNLEKLRPFVGATIGYLYGESTEESFIAGPEAGLKYFVNETTFIVGSLGYDFVFEDADEADDAFNDGRFVYNFGIGFRY